eukprot:TRINITY_DN16728_c0_g1_i1.p1 TRINITY_DN16728_c0_g1~~TRINITY_DN16728_c0_g1_i1.p1  ORF type:complete len:226 (+),score=13.75 TRINITY_DN16728_c0_g1_i1:53-679(+)
MFAPGSALYASHEGVAAGSEYAHGYVADHGQFHASAFHFGQASHEHAWQQANDLSSGMQMGFTNHEPSLHHGGVPPHYWYPTSMQHPAAQMMPSSFAAAPPVYATNNLANNHGGCDAEVESAADENAFDSVSASSSPPRVEVKRRPRCVPPLAPRKTDERLFVCPRPSRPGSKRAPRTAILMHAPDISVAPRSVKRTLESLTRRIFLA